MAEWFREVYKCDKLKVTSAYVVKDLDTGIPNGIAINLEYENNEYGDGGQITLNSYEIGVIHAVINKYVEHLNG